MADELREKIVTIVEDAMDSAIPEPWEVSRHAANRAIALLSPALDAAFQAGAEAMREASAKVADRQATLEGASVDRKDAKTLGGTSVVVGHVFAKTTAATIASTIRALPAPKREG